ncbi:MAG: hypothetical protein QOI69_1211 [Pseudonocardiales bacterium]|nr:hypothetical protein [Pseudonocardiales bacterium]
MVTLRHRGGAVLMTAGLVWAAAGAGMVAVADTAPAPSFSLTVSPTRLVVSPGQISTDQTFVIANRGGSAMDVTVTKTGFTSSTDGALQYKQDAPYSAAKWLTVTPSQIHLGAQSRQQVRVHIVMPPKPEPGDHQVALIFLVPAGKNAASIRINRGIGTPIYITVPGPVTNSAIVTALKAPSFSQGGSVPITTTVRDTGTVHRDFRATDRLYAQVNGSSVAFPDFTVPRGASREMKTTWHPPLMCICHVKVSIMGAHGVASTKTVRIIVFPIRLLVIVIGALLVLIVGWFLLRRHYRANVIRAAAALNRPVSSGDA